MLELAFKFDAPETKYVTSETNPGQARRVTSDDMHQARLLANMIPNRVWSSTTTEPSLYPPHAHALPCPLHTYPPTDPESRLQTAKPKGAAHSYLWLESSVRGGGCGFERSRAPGCQLRLSRWFTCSIGQTKMVYMAFGVEYTAAQQSDDGYATKAIWLHPGSRSPPFDKQYLIVNMHIRTYPHPSHSRRSIDSLQLRPPPPLPTSASPPALLPRVPLLQPIKGHKGQSVRGLADTIGGEVGPRLGWRIGHRRRHSSPHHISAEWPIKSYGVSTAKLNWHTLLEIFVWLFNLRV